MRYRDLVSAGALAVVIASASLAVVPVAGQAPQAPAAAAGTFTVPAAKYAPPKTPWGDPDIQGVWDYQSMIPMQRPAQFAGKATFTDAELEAWAKGAFPNQDACGVGTRANEECTPDELAGVGAYNDFWNNRNVVKDHRTSLVVDPPDGRIPPLTPQAQQRQREITGPRGPGRSRYESWEDFSAVERCIAEQTPNGVQMYNSGTLVMQSPGWLVMFRERLDTRIIALDGRPHIDDSVRQWHGNSVGRWEGNTLVVETTNFTNKQVRGGVGSTYGAGLPPGDFRVVERFVPVSPTRIEYYATFTDETTWTKPWTFMLPWERDNNYQVFEYACHEANISVANALRGERRLEERTATKPTTPTDQLSVGLMGGSEATVRAKLGEPFEILGPRWTYETVNGGLVLNVYFKDGKAVLVRPDDLALDQVKRR